MNGKRLGLHSIESPWVCFHLAPAPWLPTLHACIGCEEVFGDNLQWISVCILGWFLSAWLSERPTGCKQTRLCVDVLLPYCRLYWMGSEERGVWKSHPCSPGDLQLCVLACGCVCVHLLGWGVWKKDSSHWNKCLCSRAVHFFSLALLFHEPGKPCYLMTDPKQRPFCFLSFIGDDCLSLSLQCFPCIELDSYCTPWDISQHRAEAGCTFNSFPSNFKVTWQHLHYKAGILELGFWWKFSLAPLMAVNQCMVVIQLKFDSFVGVFVFLFALQAV